jgi:hypothetical protein
MPDDYTGGAMNNRFFLLVVSLFILAGCGKMCEFGKGPESSGMKCAGFFAQAEEGMTMKKVEGLLGTPQKKAIDVEYFGTTYDEVWVYGSKPATNLYFKNGVLEKKEYQ